MQEFLVPYKTPEYILRAKRVWAENYDAARKKVRVLKKTDPQIFFVVTYPIGIILKQIDPDVVS